MASKPSALVKSGIKHLQRAIGPGLHHAALVYIHPQFDGRKGGVTGVENAV
jgi:hypothetical protein